MIAGVRADGEDAPPRHLPPGWPIRRPLGAGDGKSFYWIKGQASPVGGHLLLVAIDEVGEVTRTRLRADWDPAAMTLQEAVTTHLSGAIAEADRDLDRRRSEAPEPAREPEPKMDMATRRLVAGG